MTEIESRNSGGDPMDQVRKAQAAARAAEAQPEPPAWGDVGQGAGRGTDPDLFTPQNLQDHAFYMKHKDAILAAARRGELPGQPNHATGPAGN